MSETELEDFENEGGAPAPEESESPATGGAGQEAPPSWGGPSEQEWKTVVGGLQYLASRAMQAEQPEEEEPDYENMNAGDLVGMYVDSRLGEITPYIEAASKEVGEKRLNGLFDQLEKDPSIGKFDRKTAQLAAEAMFPQIGDPMEAVRQGAIHAATLQKEVGKASVEEYKSSLKRTPYDDPGISGGAERSPREFKTYDEVTDYWAGQEEV